MAASITSPIMYSPKNKFQTRCSAFHPTDPAFEPSLHQHRFPLSGNAILRGRDKGLEKALEIQPTDCRETNGCTNTRRFGAFRTELGNLRSTANAWWGWKDSNYVPGEQLTERVVCAGRGAKSPIDKPNFLRIN